ncbi:sigma-70 family RNA polymerase sigma factor [Pseudomonas sp.]|uniref:sigma-70 family RNA polymerase sigma factor n=1 Tax=Pseudomonas sp. TaxID=306 RepID=UPI003D6DED9F
MSLPEQPFDYEAHLAACIRGERQALHQLYLREGARLYGVLLRLVREPALAEDLLHDAFVRIWTGAGGFDPARGSGRGWMFSVTRHLALNYLRQHRREVHDDSVLEWVASEQPAGEDAVQAARIHLCLEQLPLQRRACILHAYVDGFSHAQIARRLEVPLGTVKAWIKRSLVALRECMG